MDASQLIAEHPRIRDSGLQFLGTHPKPNDPDAWLHKREKLLLSLHSAVDASTRLPGVLKSKQVKQLLNIIEKIDAREPPAGYGLVLGEPGQLRTFAKLDPLRPEVVSVVPREPTPEELLRRAARRAKKRARWLKSQQEQEPSHGEVPGEAHVPHGFRGPFRNGNPDELAGLNLTTEEKLAKQIDIILDALEMRRNRLNRAFKYADRSEYPQVLALRRDILSSLARKLKHNLEHASPSQIARAEQIRQDVEALRPPTRRVGYIYPRFVSGGQPTLGKGRR